MSKLTLEIEVNNQGYIAGTLGWLRGQLEHSKLYLAEVNGGQGAIFIAKQGSEGEGEALAIVSEGDPKAMAAGEWIGKYSTIGSDEFDWDTERNEWIKISLGNVALTNAARAKLHELTLGAVQQLQTILDNHDSEDTEGFEISISRKG